MRINNQKPVTLRYALQDWIQDWPKQDALHRAGVKLSVADRLSAADKKAIKKLKRR